MDVLKVCQRCGAEIKLLPQAGMMFYGAFDPETGARHVCPQIEAEKASIASLVSHVHDQTPAPIAEKGKAPRSGRR